MIKAFVSGAVNGEPCVQQINGEPVLRVPVLSVGKGGWETRVTLTLWGWRAEKYGAERYLSELTRGRMLVAVGELSIHYGELDLKTHELDFLSAGGGSATE